jgi:hypothetical protein
MSDVLPSRTICVPLKQLLAKGLLREMVLELDGHISPGGNVTFIESESGFNHVVALMKMKLPAPVPVPKDRGEKRKKWLKALPSWKQAKAYALAKASKIAMSAGIVEPVSPVVRSLRQLSCHGDLGGGVAPCPARSFSPKGKFHYCNDCGCGEREDARISAVGSEKERPILLDEDNDKFSHPYLECPRQRAGFSNAGEAGEASGGAAAPGVPS